MATPRVESRRPIWIAVAVVAALTAWRVGWLAESRLDLFTDESQYWFWSTDLAFGYFSKPPLIAWIIRAATALAGETSAFWVRLPAPLLHGATALAMGWLGAQLLGNRRGALAAIGYATLPAVSAGSIVISTDTPLLLFFTLAIGLWVRLSARPSLGLAVLLGVVAGLGMLAKYAMLYFWLGAALSAALVPRLRPPAAMAGAALAAFAAVLVPNLLWNAASGFATVGHTVGNAGWGADWFQPLAMLEFLGSQLGVFGPITFAALVLAWLGARRTSWAEQGLTLFSLPILALVTLQALRAGANPNWAATAYVAGTPLAVGWLATNARRGLRLALALHLAVALLLPVATRFPEAVALPGGRSAFARLLGREALAGEILAMAREAGATVIVADNRGLLGDLLWATRDAPSLAVFSLAPAEGTRHHYDMAIPLPADPPPGTALLVSGATEPPLPPGYARATELRRWVVEQPFMAGRTLAAVRLDPAG